MISEGMASTVEVTDEELQAVVTSVGATNPQEMRKALNKFLGKRTKEVDLSSDWAKKLEIATEDGKLVFGYEEAESLLQILYLGEDGYSALLEFKQEQALVLKQFLQGYQHGE